MSKDKKPRSKKKTIIIIVIVVLIIALVTGIIIVKKKQSSAMSETQTFTRTVTLSYGSLDDTVVADGTISSQSTSSITSSATTVQVTKINAAVGDYVKEGDVIIELDTESIEKQIEREEESIADKKDTLQETYDSACDTYETAKTKYYAAVDDYNAKNSAYETAKTQISTYQTAYNTALGTANEKLQALIGANYSAETNGKTIVFKDENSKTQYSYTVGENITSTITEIIDYCSAYNDLYYAESQLESEKEMCDYDAKEKAKTTAETTMNTLATTKSSAKDARNKAEEALNDGVNTDTLDDLKEKLSDYKLKAKTSGQVTAMNATVGQMASGTLATIQDTDKLTVTVSIDEYDISSIQVGQKAKITTDAVDGEFTGEVVSISPVSSGATGGGMMAASTSSSFDVEINITSNTDGLLIGMSCEVTIYLSTIDNVFTVPVSAIETIDDKTYIYVQNSDGEFVQTEVTTGESSGYYTEVSGDNIKEGDVVRFSYNEDESEVDVDASDMAGAMDFGGGGMPSGGGNGGGGGMPSGGGAPGGFGG